MEREKLLYLMLEDLPQGVLALDLEGRVLYCNGAARSMLGLKEDPTGNSAYAVRNAVFLDFLREARNGDHEMVTLDGQEIELSYRNMMHDGYRIGAMLYLSDVGERLKLERVRQEFTANVSHELKTPLTSISGYAEMIATGLAKPGDVNKFACRIQSESQRMLTLISDIIKLSELDERERVHHVEPVDLFEIAKENVDILTPAALLKGVTLQLSGAPAVVTGNRGLMSELVYNLIDNAIRYNRDNGSVSVRVSERTVSVRDTGIGIPKSHQQRVFERFYRVDKSRSKATGGTGLGLAIVKHICEQHHAEVDLHSREGIGTEITVTFPKE